MSSNTFRPEERQDQLCAICFCVSRRYFLLEMIYETVIGFLLTGHGIPFESSGTNLNEVVLEAVEGGRNVFRIILYAISFPLIHRKWLTTFHLRPPLPFSITDVRVFFQIFQKGFRRPSVAGGIPVLVMWPDRFLNAFSLADYVVVLVDDGDV